MVKTHQVLIRIRNNTSQTFKYDGDWFDSGRLGDGENWPRINPNDQNIRVLCYERDNAWAGCSGYVVYESQRFGRMVIAFSNPDVGKNKIDVGLPLLQNMKDWSDKSVWNNMESHYNNFQTVYGNNGLSATFKNTGGDTSQVEIVLNEDNRIRAKL